MTQLRIAPKTNKQRNKQTGPRELSQWAADTKSGKNTGFGVLWAYIGDYIESTWRLTWSLIVVQCSGEYLEFTWSLHRVYLVPTWSFVALHRFFMSFTSWIATDDLCCQLFDLKFPYFLKMNANFQRLFTG